MCSDPRKSKDDFITLHIHPHLTLVWGVVDIKELSCELSTLLAIRDHI